MKKFSLLVILFLLIQFKVSGQYGWFQQTSGTTEPLFSVYFINDLTGWIVGYSGTIIKTTDGGDNWFPQNSGITNYLVSVGFADLNYGLAVGAYNILHTSNGGNTWSSIVGLPDALWEDVYFVNDTTGWIVGGNLFNGYIYKTTDRGITWINQSISTGELYSVYFLDDYYGWTVGHHDLYGTIYKTTDGGNSWQNKPYNTTTKLLSVCFPDADNGWISGQNGLIIKSTDGGETWNPQSSGVSTILHKTYLINNNIGWIAGNSGIILRTDDGGNTWQTQTVPNTSYTSLFFIDQNIGWAVGNDGIILKTINGGISFIENENNELLNDYDLSQNYPNPFNPSTKIKFTIPQEVRGETRDVTLKVYDVLGNEIATLINEEKPIGEYEVEFNGEGLTSGIYFYQLKTNNFIQTKKMLLLK